MTRPRRALCFGEHKSYSTFAMWLGQSGQFKLMLPELTGTQFLAREVLFVLLRDRADYEQVLLLRAILELMFLSGQD